MLPAKIVKPIFFINIEVTGNTYSFKRTIDIPLISTVIITGCNNPTKQLDFINKNLIAEIISRYNPPQDSQEASDNQESTDNQESSDEQESTDNQESSDEQESTDNQESSDEQESDSTNGIDDNQEVDDDKESNDSSELDAKQASDAKKEADELEELEANLQNINVDFSSSLGTSGGPSEDITNNNQNSNTIIKKYVNQLIKNNKKTILAKSHVIDGKKAAIALILRPHTVIEKFKYKKSQTKVYALIDTHTSEAYGYGDKGVFLNQFAETCNSMGIITWRANKLTYDFRTEKGTKLYEGYRTHSEWAKLAKIEKGSFIIFVGDGCLGHVTQRAEDVWDIDNTKDFVKNYKPFWIHYYSKDMNCGCIPKSMAMKSGWKFEYSIKNINSLELKIK